MAGSDHERARDGPPRRESTAGDDLLLYRHVGCPYCERVVVAMDELGVEYRSRFVVPTHSERDHVKRLSGRRSVPVLVDRRAGITMPESGNIIDHLEATYGRDG